VGRSAAISALFQMIWERKAWFLIPPVIALVVVVGLVLLAAATPLGPLIYPVY
jgi:cytochrome c oxidase subunit IV